MAEPCCGDPSVRPDHFHCHRCGHCCTHLSDRWDGDRQDGRFQALGDTPIHRVPTPGGLRMFSWEAGPFRDHTLHPMLVVPDGQREALVALAYEMEAERCPHYEDEAGCTIYDRRPLVCRAYPLLVIQDEAGLSVAVSSPCPATVPVIGAAAVASEPERALFGLYPGEAGPALAIPAMVRHLGEVVGFLASAEVIHPVPDAKPATLEAWRGREPVDLVDLVEEAGVMTGQDLRDRAEQTIRTLEERWRGQVPGPG